MVVDAKHSVACLTLSQAIDKAGPELYGPDWIGQCDQKEIDVLKKHGPAPYGQQSQSIAPCPPRIATALDRAIGKDRRMLLQRVTVLDWIRAARVMVDAAHCDPISLERQLKRSRLQKSPVGAPPVVRERVARQMRQALQSGQLSLNGLRGLKEEAMQEQFRASRRVCKEAKKVVLAELGTISN
jgi:hypothetical protein